jgi:NADH dehydrogenase FAD-containing subunit
MSMKYTVTITTGDIPRLFPDLRKHISLKVVSSANTILPMFETVMQEKGLATLAASGVDVVLNARVSAVRKGAVELQDGREIPYGLCFWAGAYCINYI